MLDFDVDILGMALKYKGYSINSANEKELNAARDALLELKPHLQAFLPTDFAKPLQKGTAVIAVDYDYDIALAQRKNKNIVWVSPSEGMPAYLDGWLAVAGTKNLPEVEQFMNFLLEPKVYAGFINNIGSAYVMPAAEKYIDPADREQREPQVRPRRAEDDRVREVPRRGRDQAPQHGLAGGQERLVRARTPRRRRRHISTTLGSSRTRPTHPRLLAPGAPACSGSRGSTRTSRTSGHSPAHSRRLERPSRTRIAIPSTARSSSSGWPLATASTRTPSWSRTVPTP